MTAAPPPRYRVVEKGRRLEVIDTWKEGSSVVRPAASASQRPGPRPGMPARLPGLGGSDPNLLRTFAFYDAKGPRRIRLSEAGAQSLSRVRLVAIGMGLALLILLIAYPSWTGLSVFALLAFGQKQLLGKARPALTRWLDTLGEDAA